MHAKRLTETVTGFKFDMKTKNKEWGKKSRSKKSQIRTLIEVLVWPCIAFMGIGTILLTALMLCCCRWRTNDAAAAAAEKEKRA